MKSVKFLEQKGIDINRSLDLFGNIESYNDKLGQFLVGIHAKIKQLIVFMQKQDLSNYVTCVSNLKNDAKYFGFNALAYLAEVHEQKASQGDLYYITNNINTLIAETNNAIVLIQEYMNGTDEEQIYNTSQQDVFNKDTILVVDDSNIIRNFVKRIFSENYNVGTAKDGEEAIRIIEANKANDTIRSQHA